MTVQKLKHLDLLNRKKEFSTLTCPIFGKLLATRPYSFAFKALSYGYYEPKGLSCNSTTTSVSTSRKIEIHCINGPLLITNLTELY